jgi:hypothetical protein
MIRNGMTSVKSKVSGLTVRTECKRRAAISSICSLIVSYWPEADALDEGVIAVATATQRSHNGAAINALLHDFSDFALDALGPDALRGRMFDDLICKGAYQLHLDFNSV